MSFTRRNVAIKSARQPSSGETLPSSASSQIAGSAASLPPSSPSSSSSGIPGALSSSPPSSSSSLPHSPSPALPTSSSTSSYSRPRLPGTRPSPVDGRPTTSTGCRSLDGLLAGHAGLALGQALLVEEDGATDYASTLLRYFAAEGVVQGQRVHVVGVGEHWGRELPAVTGDASAVPASGARRGHHGHDADGGEDDSTTRIDRPNDRMKIAWRYERLGNFDDIGPKGAPPKPRQPPGDIFCHAFDLTKRLTFSTADAIDFVPLSGDAADPFSGVLRSLSRSLAASGAASSTSSVSSPSSSSSSSSSASSSPDTVHRIVIPSLLSPIAYPLAAARPAALLPFLHGLRALLRTHAARATLMLSLQTTLYPRSAGLTRWAEQLADGVLELVPFPHRYDNETGGSGSAAAAAATSGAATAREERPQGMLRVHRLPVFHERGGGGVGGGGGDGAGSTTGSAGVDDDLAFTVSRRRFVIKPFSLPPVEGDTEAQRGEADSRGGSSGSADGRKLPAKEALEF